MRTFVSIDKLRIFARHGVFESERVNGNDFEVSVKLEYDFIQAAENDEIESTLNYAELTEMVKEIMAVPRRLIESVAFDIQRSAMLKWPQIKSGRISITKIHPPIPSPTPECSVIIEW